MNTRTIVLLSALLNVALAGCSTVKPWEREYLADEILQFDQNGLKTEWHVHVQEVQEGSRGGFSGSGGGCGCR